MPPKAAPRGGARGRGRGRGGASTARAVEVPAADPPEVKAESTVAAGDAGGKADAPAAESGVAATTEAQPDILISVSYVYPAVFGRVHALTFSQVDFLTTDGSRRVRSAHVATPGKLENSRIFVAICLACRPARDLNPRQEAGREANLHGPSQQSRTRGAGEAGS
jgi:hypothetical protein